VKLRALDRKLLRDLLHMRGQAIAIGLVVTAGVAMFVAYHSNFASLYGTRARYYDRNRFPDVFASLKRAPLHLGDEIGALPGVSRSELRVVADVVLDVRGYAEPATGRLISIPAEARPALNDLTLRRGRWIEPGRTDEVLASENFALAHGLVPGDSVHAVINGRRRALRIVGLALSPEYIYVIPPGELIPDDKRFGIFWMERRALGSAFDMEGGFNDVVLKLAPGVPDRAVIAQLDALLQPYGGLGARPRSLQMSHWTLSNELNMLARFGVLVPAIFLGVATFLLNVAMTRTLAVQRPQIAALKALGYSNGEIGWHYVKWALAIAFGGALAGIAVGSFLGRQMIGLYNTFFRFPDLHYHLSVGVAVQGALVSLAAGGLGALLAVRRAVRIPPAEAMRDEPPVKYRRALAERLGRRGGLSHATRMVLRSLERQPVRALLSIVGIAFAVGILLFGFVFVGAMEHLAGIQFDQVVRQDVTVAFVEPSSARAALEVAALPGVMAVEPFRAVPVRLRSGHRSRHLALSGLPAHTDLFRVVDSSGEIVVLPPEGIVMSRILGDVLGAREGDTITVEVLEGARPVRQVRVARLVDDHMGINAYMEAGALHRLMREGAPVSGVYLMVDPARLDELYARLKALPRVAGVGVTASALASFRRIMAQNFRIITFFNVGFAVIIAFGVVYNAARVSLSERGRELASLRVLGFTVGEISLILLGELGLLTLVSIPPGLVIGAVLAEWVLSALRSEVYRIPLVITPRHLAVSALTVLLAATLSGLSVRRKLSQLDLVAVLKTRE
jgi:putative ABC transport system permease protein